MSFSENPKITVLQEKLDERRKANVQDIEGVPFTGIEMQFYTQKGRRTEDVGSGTYPDDIEFLYRIPRETQEALYQDVSTVSAFEPQQTEEGTLTGFIVRSDPINGKRNVAIAVIGEPGRISEVRLFQEQTDINAPEPLPTPA